MGLGSAIKSGVNALGKNISKFASSTGGFDIGSLAGPLIGAGASLVGGLASQRLASNQAAYVSSMNYKQAKEFAKNQIQWRVADAKKAGIHPLAALGASLYQSAPTAVGADTSALGNGLSEMGQNLSRAFDAYQTRSDRIREQQKMDRLNDLRMSLELKKYDLDLQESQSRIALNNAKVKAEEAALKNYIRGASLYSQPRIPARVPLGYKGDNSGSGLLVAVKASDGSTMYIPRAEIAQNMQNLWGLGEAYAYGRELYAAGKRFVKKQNQKYSGYINDFTNSLNYY
ncbi:MAG: DNA pilot protein [Microviridae sp.]|nr:MAG: DNA pilot protein [Microviridae sp.]